MDIIIMQCLLTLIQATMITNKLLTSSRTNNIIARTYFIYMY